jgi:putative DNA primase/helicase
LGYKRDDDAVVKVLASLDELNYDRVRHEKAEELGVKVTTLDAKVKEERKQQEGTKTLLLPNVAPYSEAVNLAILLDQVKAQVRKHLILDDVYVDILTLWIAGTWFVPYVQIFPLLLIDAPERGCGKSQVLDLASFMSYRPLATANITPAALFRVVELEHPTLFIDEADTFIKKHDEMLGLINDGYARTTQGKVARGVIRLTGDNFTPSLFDVWGAKALAGIKLASHLPDSTLSRGLKIHVRKKLKNESIVRLRHVDTSLFDEICSKFARIALDHGEQVKNARPDLPSELNDREQDNLEVLLAISEIAGAEWSERLKKAALKLAKEGDSDISAGNELLSDIRNVAKFRRAGKIHSTELLNLLVNDESTLWPTYTNGKALTSRGLAGLLNFYGIKAKDLKFEGRTLKGFDWAQFEDAFERYLEPEILPQLRNDTPEALIYKASGVADDTQPKSAVAQRYDDLLEDIF